MARHPGGRTCEVMMPLALIGTLLVMLNPRNWSQIAADVKAMDQK